MDTKKRHKTSGLYHDMGTAVERLLEEGESTQAILKAATTCVGVWMEKRDADARLLARKGELRLSWLADEVDELIRASEKDQHLDSRRAINVLMKAKELLRSKRED